MLKRGTIPPPWRLEKLLQSILSEIAVSARGLGVQLLPQDPLT